MAVTQVKSLACLNVLYNKDSIMEVGGFDEDMGNIGEDLDINIRLNANSFKLYFVPDIPVLHKLRPDFLSWLKNMALYGKGRAIVTFKHNLFCNYFFLLPLCFIIIMILTPLGVMNQLFFLSLLYFPIICGYTLVVTLKKNKSMLYFETLMIFILTHFVYSFNLLFHSLLILLLRLDRSIASHEKVEVS
jgi:GT2 family glycosyltransferase